MRKIEQNNTDEKLTFDDICIVPASISEISSRTECSVFINDSMNPICKNEQKKCLPVFASPMGAVIDENNWEKFYNFGICPVIPRTVKYSKRLDLMQKTFVSFSIEEAKYIFLVNEIACDNSHPCYICIDVANGHMAMLLDVIKSIKDSYGDSVIVMSGNIANPDTYRMYAGVGCDFVRCSIGTGFCCTTSTLTATHYPPASLLQEIREIQEDLQFSRKYEKLPAIVADGGISSYADCIKALACGADYVMIGRMFAQCIDACEVIYEKLKDGSVFHSDTILDKIENHLKTYEDFPENLYRIYYGMSTRYAQKKIADARKDPTAPFNYRNAEGNVEEIKVNNTLDNWVDIFSSSVKSTLSYCGMADISFLRNARKIRVSVNAFMSYKKHTANK